MQIGQAIGTACATFAITNIDDAFVLVTFFAESTTSKVLTPLRIAIGQFVGFTVIVVISMIGFGISLVLPSEPIGFLGLLPVMLGIWKLLELLLPSDAGDSTENAKVAGMKGVLTVASVTLMNGGDNIGVYIPLFSQVEGAEIAMYIIVYYILLGLWLLAAFLVMRQKHVLRIVEKYVHYFIPFLYMGLGVYIIVKSDCYPWSIDQIDTQHASRPGRVIMAMTTAVLLLTAIGTAFWYRWNHKASASDPPAGRGVAVQTPEAGEELAALPSNNNNDGAAISSSSVARDGLAQSISNK
ncbi:hypothetical protein KJ359_003675 [Pestalotiopsis sp. 9143b]|nr:hypothetical protein KJ359_003675 [Pestalotiopsis sp. 9143b]